MGNVEVDPIPSVQSHITSVTTSDLEPTTDKELDPIADQESQLIPATDTEPEHVPATEPQLAASSVPGKEA